MAWRDRTNLYFYSVRKLLLALANTEPTAISPTANPMRITQRRSLDMAAPPVTVTPMSLGPASKRAVDLCPPVHLKTMVTL
jgi:hypothetical protein